MTVPIDGSGMPRPWTHGHFHISSLAWHGDELIFASNRGGDDKLWRIGKPDAQPVLIETGEPAYSPEVSRNGRRLGYTLRILDSNLYLAGEHRIIQSPREDHSPSLAPDGKRLVWISRRTGAEEVFLANTDGSGVRQLTSLNSPETGAAAWSPDGRRIVFHSGGALYMVDVDSGAPPGRLPYAGFDPHFLSGGKSIVFTTEGHLNRSSISTTGIEQVRIAEGFLGIPSLDGRWLYFTKGLATPGLFVVPLDAPNSPSGQPVPGFETVILDRNWGVVQDGLFYLDQLTLKHYSLASRQTRVLAQLDGPIHPGAKAVEVSMNSKTVVYSKVDQPVNDLMMVDNFR
jgi:hypothetical protein